ncbi:PAS domain S-box protein [Sulfurimonas sp. NW9]|uniref:PAS domain S-box protein n=1 Tax=Sulfurimonas sp. NW9 TaxID=2922728 RepID=UPI003DA9662F
MTKPTPIDEEIQLDPKRYIVSETDEKGKITYANDYFQEVSGYTEEELLGQPHSIVRHPDMPKVVFKLLWETIKQGKKH